MDHPLYSLHTYTIVGLNHFWLFFFLTLFPCIVLALNRLNESSSFCKSHPKNFRIFGIDDDNDDIYTNFRVCVFGFEIPRIVFNEFIYGFVCSLSLYLEATRIGLYVCVCFFFSFNFQKSSVFEAPLL